MMNSIEADLQSIKRKKNPARWILFPIGSLLSFFGFKLVLSLLTRPSGLFAYELPLDFAILTGGIVFLYLAISKYTPNARALTIAFGFVAFWMSVIAVQNEPPRDSKEIAICIAGISLPSYVYLIALRSKPHQERIFKPRPVEH